MSHLTLQSSTDKSEIVDFLIYLPHLLLSHKHQSDIDLFKYDLRQIACMSVKVESRKTISQLRTQ